MDVRKIVLLVGALLVAAVTAIMAKGLFSSAGTPATASALAPAEPTGPQVLVATRALPVGTILQADSFRYQPWPKELVQEAYYIKDQVAPPQPGTVVRFAITAGQPITQGAVVKPGDRGFLAAALGPGMRAVTIPVDAKSGVAGFVFPGDRIDLMLTQSVEGNSGPSLKTAETFVRNVRVLATDQRTDSTTKEGKVEVVTFSTVTLEATPRIAEKIALAQSLGQLSISLRSIADNNAELERAIASGEVSVGDAKDPKTERQLLLTVASRPIDTDTTFVTGADVSRFQRRTMPRMTGPAPESAPTGGAPAASSPNPNVPTGPVVKVARGNNVTVVTVGGR